MMKRQTQHTDAESAGTFTGSIPKKSFTTDQFRAVQESLKNGTHNPFQRVDGAVLERLHKLSKKHFELDDVEDAWL